MKFIRKGAMSSGWSPPFIDPQEYMMLNTSLLSYFTLLYPYIKPAPKYEDDKRERVEMRWFYLVGYNEMLLLRYDFEQDYYIEENETSPTDEQLTDIIKDSYRLLQNAFKERLEEFIVIKPVQDITDKVIEQALAPLRELFPLASK